MVETLARADEAAAAAVLARAFQADPMMAHLIPDPARRERQLPRFLGSLQRYCLTYGTVMVDPELSGVACWLPPGGTDVTVPRMARTGMVTAALSLGIGGLRRMLSLTSVMERDHHRVMTEPHWYLWLLGTDPTRVGRGIASALLRPVLAQADDQRMPSYLETHSEANLRFYAKRGFEPVIDKDVAGVHYWGLRRSPRPSTA
jgi:GNAT superfamily N-acetyltransferase